MAEVDSFKVGVLMLNTRFPRLPGDIGNPDSLPCEVIIRRVDAARVDNVVGSEAPEAALQQILLQAGDELQAQGTDLLVTSCGFLSCMQDALAARYQVPVIASSLVLMPFLRTVYGPAEIGVLTFDSRKLTALHFNGWFDEQIGIAGIEQGKELYRVISQDETELDAEQAEQDVLMAVDALRQRQPGIRVLVLECTNLSPYRAAIKRHTGLPVYDLMTAVNWVRNAHL
ncbi:aspartate/glutamate racemase family protein [Aliamphritea hakodatensis]|uniref:aspartate/glutamate racemase family protein n=1 Tax=Aliamphritea hakodatensis TaxID=2895352 RepID=UPI0022FD5921|nr:aspartate/glutamate racemase family protein [Aliamphritea hakodatensis]